MMHDDDIERMLEELPSRGLSSDAHARISAAVSRSAPRAQHPPAKPWWSSGVPLWLATAACFAMCATTAFVVRSIGDDGTGTTVVKDERTDDVPRSEEAAVRAMATAGPETDIARWRVLDVRTENSS